MAVPIQTPPPPSYSEQIVRRMEAEHKLLADERFTGWAVIWTLFAFKMGTVILIMYVGRHSSEAGTDKSWAYIISTTWFWFIIPLVAFSGFVAWRLRLRRARKQAQHLKRSEFSLLGTSELGPLTEEEKARLRQVQLLDEHDR
jgi:hypothetical protein